MSNLGCFQAKTNPGELFQLLIGVLASWKDKRLSEVKLLQHACGSHSVLLVSGSAVVSHLLLHNLLTQPLSTKTPLWGLYLFPKQNRLQNWRPALKTQEASGLRKDSSILIFGGAASELRGDGRTMSRQPTEHTEEQALLQNR